MTNPTHSFTGMKSLTRLSEIVTYIGTNDGPTVEELSGELKTPVRTLLMYLRHLTSHNVIRNTGKEGAFKKKYFALCENAEAAFVEMRKKAIGFAN